MIAAADRWGRELKIPAKGRWGCGWGGKETWWAIGHVLGAGNVLDEVDVVGTILLLVHAFTGCSLPLEWPPFGGAC